MTTYRLKIEIDPQIFGLRPSDNLCIARKGKQIYSPPATPVDSIHAVNQVFNVVLHGASIIPTGRQDSLMAKNVFQWQDEFRVLCARDYRPPFPVSAATDQVEIHYGQQALYNTGKIESPKAANPTQFMGGDFGTESILDSFIVTRVPSKLKVACECKTVGGRWDPIYVDPGSHVTVSDRQITPSHEYVIFWDGQLTPNAVFRYNPAPEKKEFAFEQGETEKSFRFGYAIADQRKGDEEARFY
ncbi:proteinral negative regulator of transcription subunit 1 [Elsinoe australis]|uniref:Proteinral negative regulator of transcription subunit 1 n=1 Tax=Elsinoe australis TaxID=40998 RepID=A0A2P7YVY3_9PEZI|nr:proteinral negative regulator of transcription subunit 1 [Elsinoe australis]